jgi:hypothetical protein
MRKSVRRDSERGDEHVRNGYRTHSERANMFRSSRSERVRDMRSERVL